MAHMATRAKALLRGVGGRAGDARVAGGRRIASNVVAQLAFRSLTIGIGVITASLTARTLDPSGYGVWNGVLSYVGLFGIVTDLGFTVAALQRMSAEPERESEWLGALAGTRIVFSVLAMALCAISIPIFLSDAPHAHLVAYILITTGITAGSNALMSVFQSRLRAGLVLSFTVLQSVGWLIAVLILAATGGDVVDFAVAWAALILFVAAVQLQATRRLAHIAWRRGARLWRPLVRLAVPLGISAAMITVYDQFDSILLLQIAGSHEAGIYAAAYGFLAPLSFLPTAIVSSFFPVMSATYPRDPPRVKRLVQTCADSLAVITFPILAGSIALAEPIVHLLYGPGYGRTAGLLPILMLAFVWSSYGSLAGFMSAVLGVQWRLAVASTGGAVLNILLNIAVIPKYGAYGSAWATVATETVTMTFMLLTCLHTLGMRLRLWSIARTLVLAALMTGVMVLARPLGLLPAGVIGVAFFLAGLPALRIVDADMIRSLRTRAADPTAATAAATPVIDNPVEGG
jgi:O-antigen/teichoic acid export membrane protein